MYSIAVVLLTVASLLLISIFSSKLASRYGIPALLIFLGVGMLFGSDGLNWIYFDDFNLAQSLGIVALTYILFSGGLDTDWEQVRPIALSGIALSTIGVVTSATVVGLFSSWLLGLSLLEGILIGAIVSSTDAAAVFTVLNSKAMGFKYYLKELMEFESGTNDPMAIFLTIGMLQLLTMPGFSGWSLALLFIQQMTVGLLAGYLLGKIFTWIVNNANLEYDGLYPVLVIALVPLVYAVTDMMGGSGFLAVYLTGLVMGNTPLIHYRSLVHFFDGIAWLMQIAMFLILGLLVFPQQILSISTEGLVIALVLILVARPVSVFIALLFSGYNLRSKLMVSWTGLRGAVPIIMATFPLVAGIENAVLIFSIVFFIVVSSVLIQGPTIPLIARMLGVDSPIPDVTKYPIEFEPSVDTKSALKEMIVEEGDPADGLQVIDLNFPSEALIVLINREGHFMVPRGTTEIMPHDKLLVLAQKELIPEIREKIKGYREAVSQ